MQPVQHPQQSTVVQVERVKFLRHGEARGDYDKVVEVLNASDPHGEQDRGSRRAPAIG